MTNSPQSSFDIHSTRLCKESEEETQEILRHKWFESERAGRDVGYGMARIDWVIRHRAKWLKCKGDR